MAAVLFVKFSGKGIGSIQVLYIEKDVFYDHVLREVLSQFRVVRIADHIPCQPVKPGKGCQAAVFCRAGVLQLLFFLITWGTQTLSNTISPSSSIKS